VHNRSLARSSPTDPFPVGISSSGQAVDRNPALDEFTPTQFFREVDLSVTLNREFALVAACCLWPPSPRTNAAITAAAGAPIDWARFLKVVRRHRVPTLVRNGLSRAGIETPPDIAQLLEADADRTTRASLINGGETIRLQRLFDQGGCQSAFVKGATLAALGYGDFAIRHARDIDMIVPEAQFPLAFGVLAAAGYRQIRPPESISAAQFALWRAHGKDMEWRNEQRGIVLELHWRLTTISFLLNEPPDFSALHAVAITPSGKVMTLPPPDLFVYLCVHGSAHGWFRLKWLADIHALVAAKPTGLIETYYGIAKTKGVERAMGQAMLLCEEIFGLRLPSDLAAELHSSRAVTMLAKIGLLCMTRGRAEKEINDQPFGTTLVNVSYLLLTTRIRAWVTEAWHQGICLDDVLFLPLPRSLRVLYWLLRWPLWLFRRTVNFGAVRSHRSRQ
jgi:hypothetical protein